MFLVLVWLQGVLGHRCRSFFRRGRRIVKGMSRDAILHLSLPGGEFIQMHPWRCQWWWRKVCWGQGGRVWVVWKILPLVGQMLFDRKVTISILGSFWWGQWVGGQCLSSLLWTFCSSWWIPEKIRCLLLLLGLAILQFWIVWSMAISPGQSMSPRKSTSFTPNLHFFSFRWRSSSFILWRTLLVCSTFLVHLQR